MTAWNLPGNRDDAELIVSELVTNAVAAVADPAGTRTGHVVGVWLRLHRTGLFIEVWDTGAGVPGIPHRTDEAESGRGLFLVQALSRRWGACHAPDLGKVVWAQLTSAP